MFTNMFKGNKLKKLNMFMYDLSIHQTISWVIKSLNFGRSHQVMTDCLLEPVYTECGESAAMFLEEITTNSRPPVCQKLPRKYLLQQSDNNGANCFAVTSLATWCSLLFWMLVLIKPSLKL